MFPRECTTLLFDSFLAAIAAADPLQIVARELPAAPARGPVLVVGAGKAAAAMAYAVEAAWPDVAIEGIVITRYGHGLATRSVRVVEAGHPVPDDAGAKAAAEILRRATRMDPSGLMLVLVSGGGSSLMTLPAEGLGMDDLQALNRELLRCGAPIADMNIVRKHVSAITGGRLAAACPAPVLALIISDVTGDDPSAIASGPCAPDASTFQAALDIVARYQMQVPSAVLAHLSRGSRGEIAETPKANDPLFGRVRNHIIATPHGALESAAAYFRAQRIPTAILGDTVTGEAREAAKVYAALVREICRFGQPWRAPIALISGGECTVTIPKQNSATGRGGRCTEFLLALAIELEGMADVSALACDTDGIDGSEDNAGAILYPDTLLRARAQGLSAERYLASNDAWGFFSALDDLVVTGPTRTNVNDYRVILIHPKA